MRRSKKFKNTSSTSKKQRIGGVATSRSPRLLWRSANGKSKSQIFRRQVYKLRRNEFQDQIIRKDAIIGQTDSIILGTREEGNRASKGARNGVLSIHYTKLDFEQCTRQSSITLGQLGPAIRTQTSASFRRTKSRNISDLLLCTTLGSLYPIALTTFPVQGCECGFAKLVQWFRAHSKREQEKPKLRPDLQLSTDGWGGAPGEEKGGYGGPGAESRGRRLCFERTQRRSQDVLSSLVKWVVAKWTFSNDNGHYAAFEIPDFENRILSRWTFDGGYSDFNLIVGNGHAREKFHELNIIFMGFNFSFKTLVTSEVFPFHHLISLMIFRLYYTIFDQLSLTPLPNSPERSSMNLISLRKYAILKSR